MNAFTPSLKRAIQQAGGDPDRGFLIADIRPNEAGTAMVDYSPYGWTVTELGAGSLTYDTEKVTFDGTNWLRVEIDPALVHLYNANEKFTLEITMSVATGATLQRFICARKDSGGGSHNWIHSITTGDVIETIINNSASTFNSAQTITPGVEFDFKWLVNGANKLILVDNEPAGSADYNNTAWTNVPSEYLYIGAFASSGSNPLTSGSYIKRVRIYRGILKHDIEVPTAAFTSDANTECLVSFDGADGDTTATDRGPNSNTLTFGTGCRLKNDSQAFGTTALDVDAAASSAGVTYPRTAGALGTADHTFECFYKPDTITSAGGSSGYKGIVSDNLHNAAGGFVWYARDARFDLSNASGAFLDTISGLTTTKFRHCVWQRENNVSITWIDGKCVGFAADATNYTATTVRIGAGNTGPIGADGRIFEYRDSTVARYTPTLMRDETVYDVPSAESGANWFASDFYTGTGASNELDFADFDLSSGALAIIKPTTAVSWRWQDTERGAGETIFSNGTDAETTESTTITSFDADGLTLGTSGSVNGSGTSFRLNVFRADLSESVTVDSQSLTLKHSGKGFGMIEIDRALGGASASISIDISAMGLVSAPMVVVKNCDSATNWAVWHPGLTSGYYLLLNSNAAEVNTSASNFFGNNSTTVDPTSSTLVLGSNTAVGGSGVDRIIVYIFGEVSATDSQNYIKLLDFAHTSGQVSYVDCGWQAGLSWLKMNDVGSTDWVSRQTKRGTGLATLLNSSAAEATNFGAHGPFGAELNGTYAATGNIIGMAVRGN